jgi:hypothetical protein
MPDSGGGCVAAVQAPALGGIRCRLDQLDVVLWLVDLVEIGRARIRSAGKGHIYGRVTVTLAKCAG